VLKLDFRDHRELGEHVPAKMPKEVEKLQELINPVTITRDASDLIFKTQGLYSLVSKYMKLHTSLAESVYMARTQSDIVERRRQAKLDYAKHEAEEAERQRKREEEDALEATRRVEEDALAEAMRASLAEAAGVKPKSRKRKSRKD